MNGSGHGESLLDFLDLMDASRSRSGKLFSALALHSAVPGC